MIILQNADALAQSILPSIKVNNTTEYKLSPFVLAVFHDERFLLFNNLTKKYVVFTEIEANNFGLTYEIKDQIVYFENVKFNGNSCFKSLICDYFFVPNDLNMIDIRDKLLSTAKILCKNSNLIKTFVIFPTTGCNARCFYCFEKGMTVVNMSEETAVKLADFIIEKSGGEKIELQWFGGEPLYNLKVIDIICQKLIESSIEFNSSIISNGYLFDEDVIKKAKNIWKLKNAQITLDGQRDTYNKVKNYIYNDTNPYEKVLNNIDALLANDIGVNVRLNMDMYNCDELKDLILELRDRFDKYKRFRVYVVPIYENVGTYTRVRDGEVRSKVTEKLFELQDMIEEFGFNLKKKLSKKIRLYRCMADDPNTILVAPDGNFGYCEVFPLDDSFGNLDNVGKKGVWSKYIQANDDCASCVMYPSCIRLLDCSNGRVECFEYERMMKIRELKNAMIIKYDNDGKVLCKIADFNMMFFTYADTIKGQISEYVDDCVSDKVDINLTVSNKDIENESSLADDNYSRVQLGFNAYFRKLAEWLPLNNAFVLHSCTIDVNGTGVAFAAHSGTGKTTHMNLWQQLLGDKMTIVNGDKPIVRFFDEEPKTPYAYGNPWMGKERLGCNMRTPLKHICFITRSETNSTVPITKAEALPRILNQVYMPKDPAALAATLTLINRLLDSVSLWEIRCNMDIEAAKIAYSALFGNKAE